MATMPLTLELDDFGTISGQLYSTPNTATQTRSQKLVVLLHGWGADGADLLPLASDTVLPNSGDSVFVPDAPNVCSANPLGRQWFELHDSTVGLKRNAEACHNRTDLITAMLDRLCTVCDIGSGDVILGGFSQGGMLSLTGGLAYAQPLCGLFCLSGAWLTPNQTCRQGSNLPIFLAHGDKDPVVPAGVMQHTEQALHKAGFQPQTLLREQMAHAIDSVVVKRLAAFIHAL